MAYFSAQKPDTKKVNKILESSILELENQIKKLKISVTCEHEWELKIKENRSGPTIDRYEFWICKNCSLKR